MDVRGINDYTSQAVNYRTTEKTVEKETVPQQTVDSVQMSDGLAGEPAAPKKWTIMHYTAGDNNLTWYLVQDVNEMEVVGSTQNMNLVVQLDRGGSDCKRYYLEKDGNMSEIKSPVIKDLGSTNMSDPQVLAAFIKETKEKYPAQHYALILSDHGYAWKGAIEDQSHHGWMTMPDIREGVEKSGVHFDLIGFDACLMATSEVAEELSDVADFLVASQQTEGGSGWPYTPLLTKKTLSEVEKVMQSKLDISPEEFAKKIVDTAEGDQDNLPTMSAINLKDIKVLRNATNLLAGQILLTDTPKSVLKKFAANAQSFYGFKDQYHFAEQIVNSEEVKDAKLKKAAMEMMKAIKKVVVKEEHSKQYPNAHGLTAEIPSYGGVDSGYGDLKYAKYTLWDEAMNHINS